MSASQSSPFSGDFSEDFTGTFLEWMRPLSEPTPPKRALQAASRPAFFYPLPQAPESPLVTKWAYNGLSLPTWPKTGMHPSRVPDFFGPLIGTQLPVITFKEKVSLDRWRGQSVDIVPTPKIGLHPSRQQSHFEPVFTAAPTSVPPDRWYYALSTPVWQRAALQPADQQTFAWNISTALENTSVDRWFSPLSLFPGKRPGLAPASQQAHTEPVTLTLEPVTVDRWHNPLSLFPGVKPGLAVAHQLAFTQNVIPAGSNSGTLMIVEAGDTFSGIGFIPNIASLNITESSDVLNGIASLSLRYSDTLRNNIISQTQITIGSGAKLVLFSGTEAVDCSSADPSGPLCTINLPPVFLVTAASPVSPFSGEFSSEFGGGGAPGVAGTATLTGSWSSTASATGTAASFRIYDSVGTCHVQGNISDLGLIFPNLVSGQFVQVTAFTIVAPG